MASPGFDTAPGFDGQGVSFLDFEKPARLWPRATKAGPASRTSFLVPYMNSVPRQVCLSAGGAVPGHRGGTVRVMEILRTYFVREAAAASSRRVMTLSHFRR